MDAGRLLRVLNWREKEYIEETFDHFDFTEEQKEEVFCRIAKTDKYGNRELYNIANQICAEVEIL